MGTWRSADETCASRSWKTVPPARKRLKSTQSRPSGSREHGGSPLRQAGEAQAGDIEFEKFRCQIVSHVAKSGDGQLGVVGKHSTEFGACLVTAADMGIGGDLDPHRCERARLVVQGAVRPFDRLFEASRGEMSGRNIRGVEKGIRIE